MPLSSRTMSLRARLALLYTSIVGGVLLLFGVAVYFLVSFTLTNRVDDILINTSPEFFKRIRVGDSGELIVNIPPDYELANDVQIQVWRPDKRLVYSTSRPGFTVRPMDEAGLGSSTMRFSDVIIAGDHYKVLTIPLILRGSQHIVGYLQAGANVTDVELVQRALLLILFTGVIISMSLAGLAGWYSTSQALAPLNAVRQTAQQITRADDLSRRIPYQGPDDDEVGQLIEAFNQTLGRLENLFTTQRRFLADVGHELRTPLTVIKGNLGLMRRMGVYDAESMDSIESEVDRLTRLVGDLLLLAQAESGKLPLAWRLVELDTLVLEVLQEMRVLAHDKLSMRLGDIDQVLVCGDQDRLKQVLVNLIGNAIKYTPVGGEIRVGMTKVERQVRLTISDNGPGIPSEDLPHIFERFYRGEKSRTRSKDGKGFGLGLSIAYWIIRNHGGLIEVGPNQPRGTTFCVWLPLANGDCKEPPSTGVA